MKPILFEKTATDFTSLGIARLPDCVSCLVTEERNGIYELEMVYPVSGRYFSEISEDRLVVVVPHDGGTKQAFRIYRISTPINGEVTINARHISYQMNFIPVSAVSGTNKTAAQMMTALKGAALENCPFTFSSDISTKTAYNISLPVSMKASLGGMQGSVLDLYGGEYEWDNWSVILHRARGSDRGVRITYGKNLTDLTRTTDIGDTITGVAAYYSGQDQSGNPVVVYSDPLVISNSNVSDYAHARTVPLDLSASFETVPTRAQVTAAAQAYLAVTTLAQASEAISVDFVALWQSPEYKDYAPLERVNLCDIVYVGYKQLGVSVKKKVTKTVYNVILDRYDTIELGGEATLADTLVNMDGELTGTIKDITSLEKVINGKVSKAGDEMSGGLRIKTGGTATDNGLVVQDTDYGLSDLPSTAIQKYILTFKDKALNALGYIRGYINQNGRTGIFLGGRNTVNGSAVTNLLSLLVNADGTRLVTVTEAAPWRTALGLGSMATVDSPVSIAQGGTGQSAAVDACQALLARPWKQIGSIASGGTASVTITFTNTCRGMLYINGTNANRTGIYMFYGSTASAFLTPIVPAGANITITQNANTITISNASTSSAWIVAEFFDKSYYSRATVS